MPPPVRIAVDAMGGDEAPLPEVEGSLAAVEDRELEVILVGDEPRLRELLGGRSHPRLTLRHASQVIAMDDPPSAAVKSKKDSSMRVCFDLARRGEAQAVLSAGNSGAMMACGLFVMKRLPGVERPGILTIAPTADGSQCVALDVGANTAVKPSTLAQFAVLGATYARTILGKERPRVGVLSNGEEESKGTDLTREAHRILRGVGDAADFVYSGYAEGRDFFTGEFDVVVTDGFTGNIALKTFEGGMRMIFALLRAEVEASSRAKIGALLMKPAFDALKRRMEPDEFGGAPLLGVDGVAIIGHGKSSARAIKNGIFTADRFVAARLAPAIAEAIARHRPLLERPAGEPSGAAVRG
ncbi:MAG: phosphate acyltransferase PlsX [Myxococcales bacterium]|nr:phosphate acyltransferase PlsX [Myxococcales bacterium]